MANYNLYKGINTGEIKSKANSLKEKVNSAKGKLSSFEGSLSDGIWKANSKNTLKEAFTKLNGEVTSEIINALEKAVTVAGYIDDYNEAKTEAESYKSKIASADPEKDAANISSWESALSNAESKMDQAEANVKSNL